MQRLGLIGIWGRERLIDGAEMKKEVLPNLPKGPAFGTIMEEQDDWMTSHPGGGKEALVIHLRNRFPEYA